MWVDTSLQMNHRISSFDILQDAAYTFSICCVINRYIIYIPIIIYD